MSAKAWDQLLAYEATLGEAFAGLPAAVESAPGDWKVTSEREKKNLSRCAHACAKLVETSPLGRALTLFAQVARIAFFTGWQAHQPSSRGRTWPALSNNNRPFRP